MAEGWFRVVEGSGDDEELKWKIREWSALSRANAPRSLQEAAQHVREGLVRVIDACELLRNTPQEAPFSGKQWHGVRLVCELLFTAVKAGDGAPVDALVASAQRARKRSPGMIAGAANRVQEKAREFAEVLRRAKTIGMANAILAIEGRSAPTTAGDLPTRRKVATYLAVALSYVDRELPAPVLNTTAPDADRAQLILERMPMGHGLQVDRLCQFAEEPFTEDPEKAVVAAFKALGMSAARADQLFKARLAKQNRARASKRRDVR